jgi:hypothetical protein
MVISKNLFQLRFEDFISLFSSDKFLVIKNREHKALFGFNVLMLIIHILSVSLFLFVLYRIFVSPDIERTTALFLRISTAYAFFVMLKITVEKIVANIFEIDEVAEHYLFQKHTYRNFISIMLFPVTIFLIYTPYAKQTVIFVIVAVLFVAIFSAFFKMFSKNQGLISRNWFYFILYLCALEITPYVILYKLITTM